MWTVIETGRRLRPGMFVAQVVGRSMEPAIPDGAYCLFAAPVEGTRQGRTLLVQMRATADPESGERYTVKRYESEKAAEEDSWQHKKITLRPVNPEFEPIVLTGTDQGTLQVVAEVVEVLGEALLTVGLARDDIVRRLRRLRDALERVSGSGTGMRQLLESIQPASEVRAFRAASFRARLPARHACRAGASGIHERGVPPAWKAPFPVSRRSPRGS